MGRLAMTRTNKNVIVLLAIVLSFYVPLLFVVNPALIAMRASKGISHALPHQGQQSMLAERHKSPATMMVNDALMLHTSHLGA